MQERIAMALFTESIKGDLRSWLTGQVCVVGIGNRLRRDDGAGPHVIDSRRPQSSGCWIDAGVAPENFLEPIARTDPDAILLIDAVNFGGPPGACRLIEPSATDMLAISTHAGSLSMLAKYLSSRTGARLLLVGIQPDSIDAGEGLSEPVASSVQALAAMLSDLLTPKEPKR
jgi:hydrogenase 3 maturation protease